MVNLILGLGIFLTGIGIGGYIASIRNLRRLDKLKEQLTKKNLRTNTKEAKD